MRAKGIPQKSAPRVPPLNATQEKLDLSRADWNDLRLFRVIVKQGSFRAAAKEEKVVVNTIRRHLGLLEKALGRLLVRRTTKGIFPTEAGKHLAQTIAEMSEATFDARTGSSNGVLIDPGELTIACSEGLATFWLTPRLAELRQAVPDLTIGLICDYDLARDRSNEADIWLSFEKPKRQDLITSRLATLHFLPFASPAYLHEHGTPQTVDDLKSHRIVEHCAAGAHSELLDYLIGSDRPKGLLSLRTNSSLAQLWAVATGQGLGGLPTYVPELTRAIMPVPPLLQIRRELWLVYRADGRHSAAVQAAVRWLRAIFDPVEYPCFREKFVHPDDFPARPQAEGTVWVFPSPSDQLRSRKPAPPEKV